MTPEQQHAMLELVSTNDLADELLDRFDHAFFYGIKERPTDDVPSLKITCFRRKGDIFVCQGALVRVMRLLQDAYDEAEEEISADDL